MAISGSRLIDGLVKTQMRADAARRQSDELRQNCFDLRLVYRAGAVRVDIERQRLGHADSIAELDSAALGKACGNDILGEIAAYIRGGTVNLGRVLARKGAAAMRSRAAIGVDNDLATSQTSVDIRPADFEKARGIDGKERKSVE